MEKNRVISLLRAFTPAELAAFGKFLKSPYFNHRQDVVALYDFLLRSGSLRKTCSISQMRAFEKVFPGMPYNEKKLGYTLSFLHKLAQKFLIVRDLETKPEVELELELARLLKRRRLKGHYQTALRKAESALDEISNRDISYYELRHKLHLEKYETETSERRTASRYFGEMADAGDLVFIGQKLRQSCTAIMHKAISETNVQLQFLDEVLRQVETKQLERIPAIALWYYGYKALSSSGVKIWFERLREAMTAYSQLIPRAEMRDITMLAINYCIRQVNTQQEEKVKSFWLNQVFEIYKEGLEKGVFFEGGYLSRFTYNNIANAGLGLQAYDWVESFLVTYKDALEPTYREGAFQFNMATLYFRKPDYNKALDYLIHSDFDDVLHSLDARRMLLRIYFDKGEINALNSLLDSFTIFLRRRKDIGYLRQHYLNLVRFTKKILRIPPTDSAAILKLRSEIKNCKALAERAWLLEQL